MRDHLAIDARLLAKTTSHSGLTTRRRCSRTNSTAGRHLLPGPLTTDSSKCLVDGMLARPFNIRTYLSLYREALIVVPVEQGYADFLRHLGITEDELIWLALIGRVTLVLPHSLDTYAPSLIVIESPLKARPVCSYRAGLRWRLSPHAPSFPACISVP